MAEPITAAAPPGRLRAKLAARRAAERGAPSVPLASTVAERPPSSARSLADPIRRSLVASGSGIRCPRCGGAKTEVIDSRPGPKQTIRRRRACTECTVRFSTNEVAGATARDVLCVRDELRTLRQTCAALLARIDDVLGDEA